MSHNTKLVKKKPLGQNEKKLGDDNKASELNTGCHGEQDLLHQFTATVFSGVFLLQALAVCTFFHSCVATL
jgi:hypothetical protein